jgi:hypothetical protein
VLADSRNGRPDEHTSLKAIGFISWVGLAYSLKWLWSPVVDRVDLPLLGRLGRRRGWMAFAQILVAVGLIGIALVGPSGPGGLTAIGAFALVTAFASATQDIAIDAWRIEAANNSDEQGLLSSAAALGYRAAIIAADALILAVAARIGWPGAYIAYAFAMGIGLAATWFAFEPVRAEIALKAQAPLWNARGFFDAVVGPFIDFFRQHKALGLLMLAAIAVYRLPDFVMGPMYTPYYVDLGLTKDAVAAVRGSIGLFGALAGVAAGGLSAVRLGLFPTLIAGALARHGRLRPARALSRQRRRVQRGDGRRQLRPGLRRHRAHRLHVEPDQPRLHRHPICAVVLGLCGVGQVPEGVLRRGDREPGGGLRPDAGLRDRFCRRGPDRDSGDDPVPGPGSADPQPSRGHLARQ